MSLKDFKGKKGVILHEGHSYVTRRQLLGAGVIPFAAGLMMPSLWDIFMRNGIAQAATCASISNTGDGLPAILNINLNGGPAMGRYGVPMVAAGTSILTSAGQLGLGTSSSTYNQTPMFGNSFLVPTSNGSSLSSNLGGFFGVTANGGVTQTAAQTSTTLSKTTVIANACDTGDDTSTDALDFSGMVSKWIATRKLAPLNNGSSANESKAFVTPPAFLNVNSVTSVGNAIAPATGALNATLTNKQKQDVYNLAASLSGTQANILGSNPDAQTMSDLLNCAGVQNVQIAASSAVAFDPRQDPVMQTIYGITTGSSASSSIVIEATIVYNLLKGNAPFGRINIGGNDYHGNAAQTSTNPKDQSNGAVLNRALQAAAALGQKFYCVVTADGATGCDSVTAAGGDPTGDRGSGSASYLLVYDPAKTNTSSRNWINGYTSGNVANSTFSSTDQGSVTALFYNIVHNFTGSTSAADTIFSTVAGAPTASQVSSFIII